MGLLKTIKKAAKNVVKGVAKAAGVDTSAPKPQAPDATLGPTGDTGSRATQRMDADRRRRRGARGRDSTIITARSDIGSRTLLG